MQLNWTIIGCGWLGASLAEKLIERGHTVFGSTTTEAKLFVLNQKGINAFVLNEDSMVSSEISHATDIVVLSIPPIKRAEPTKYGNYLCSIASQFKSDTRFIFLGSTGIYPQKSGLFTENYIFESNEKATTLYHAEEQLNEQFGERLTRLRLGGLIGENRNPVRSMSGKVDVKNPKGVINFVDKRDVIEVILDISENNAFGQVFNIVYPFHPTRENYYTEQAKAIGFPAPKFDYSNSITREICSDKVITELSFIFEHPVQ